MTRKRILGSLCGLVVAVMVSPACTSGGENNQTTSGSPSTTSSTSGTGGAGGESVATSTSSGGGEGGQGGTGAGGAGGTGGEGGAVAEHGPSSTETVSAGAVVQSSQYKMIYTLGQPTQNQGTTKSSSYRLQGGVVGANGSLP